MTEPILLTGEEVEALPSRLAHGGVRHQVIWQGGRTRVGVIHVPPGGRAARRTHEGVNHELWVHDGSCEVLGRYLRAGGFAHVPPGVAHDIVAGPTGCTIVYVRSPEEAW